MHNTSNTSATPTTKHPMPFVRMELAVLRVHGDTLEALLSKRKEAPHKGRLALPGGVLRIDLDSSLEAAAQRVAMERLGMALPNLSQVCAAGGPKRDPRAPWALSVLYRSLAQPDIDATPGKRVESLQWQPADDAIAHADLAFDHAALLRQAVAATRSQIAALDMPVGWMPEPFTLAELRGFCEAVLAARIDPVTLRRRLEAHRFAEPLSGQFRQGGKHRPAQLYRLAVSLPDASQHQGRRN